MSEKSLNKPNKQFLKSCSCCVFQFLKGKPHKQDKYITLRKVINVEENKEIQTEVVETEAVEVAEVVEAAEVVEDKKPAKKSRRRKIETVEPTESEWKEQVVQIRRVTKVVNGG